MSTRLIGNDGAVSLPTGHQNSIIDTWRANVINTIVEVTGFTDTTNRRHRGGLIDIQGSASGTPFSATGDPGAAHASMVAGAAMTLTVATNATWAFTGLMSNIGLESIKLAAARITFDFTTGDAADFAETWT